VRAVRRQTTWTMMILSRASFLMASTTTKNKALTQSQCSIINRRRHGIKTIKEKMTWRMMLKCNQFRRKRAKRARSWIDHFKIKCTRLLFWMGHNLKNNGKIKYSSFVYIFDPNTLIINSWDPKIYIKWTEST